MGFFGASFEGRHWFGTSGGAFFTAEVYGQIAVLMESGNYNVAGQVAALMESGSFAIDGQISALIESSSHNVAGQISALIESGSIAVASSGVWDNYQALGSIDLTGRMYGANAKGFDLNVKTMRYPGGRKHAISHQGIDGPIYTFGTGYASGYQASRDLAFAAVDAFADVDGITEARFYPRDSLWYHKAQLAEAKPIAENDTWDFWLDCKVWLSDPYLYYYFSQTWAVSAGTLPQTSESMENHGSIDDCFESIAITGHYASPNHVEDLVLSVAGGDSMTLSDHLLDEEKITLGVDGSLITEWTATLSSLAAFQVDASLAGTVTFSTDHISIAASSSAIVVLSGPYPTKEPIKLTTHLTITGTASVQISTDGGSTYTDGVTTGNISSGASAIYYLTGTGREDEIYIKFNCPSASTMLIHSLKIERVLDCSGATLPKVVHGSSAAFTVACDVAKSTTATIAATYRPRRLPV
jgi:hypothetical protein